MERVHRIFVEAALRDHPKLHRLASRLRVTTAAAAGHLVFLWSWFGIYRPDGRAPGVPPEVLAEASGWPLRRGKLGVAQSLARGELFIQALLDTGWIELVDGVLQVHDWQENQGKFIDSMLKARERVRRHRERACNVTETSSGSGSGSGSVDEEKTSDLVPKSGRDLELLEQPNGVGRDNAADSGHVSPPCPSELIGLTLFEDPKKGSKLRSRWPTLFAGWLAAYPGLDILGEIRKAHGWLLVHPKRAASPQFLNAWLNRANDDRERGASVHTNGNGKFVRDPMGRVAWGAEQDIEDLAKDPRYH